MSRFLCGPIDGYRWALNGEGLKRDRCLRARHEQTRAVIARKEMINKRRTLEHLRLTRSVCVASKRAVRVVIAPPRVFSLTLVVAIPSARPIWTQRRRYESAEDALVVPIAASLSFAATCRGSSLFQPLLSLDVSSATGQLRLLAYIPDRSKQQGRRFPLASMSQALSIRLR